MNKCFKLLPLSCLFITSILLSGCGGSQNPSDNGNNNQPEEKFDMKPVTTEIARTFNYFMRTTNLNEDSDGYGLVQDRFTIPDMASIAATGFALASYPIYVEEGLLNKTEAEAMVSKSLDTFIRMQTDSTTSYAGCISHFVNKQTAKRWSQVEISTIDTSILVSGAIVAGEYFKGEVQEKAQTLWGNVDFNKFKVKVNGLEHISMGVKDPMANPKQQISAWNGYAEHLMIYLLGAGNPVKARRFGPEIYDNMSKKVGSYGQYEYINSWFGSLFTYQFSHAFFNFNLYEDNEGINWHENSVLASKAAYQYCQDYSENFKSFSENSWGLTACDTPLGYSGLLGTPARGYVPDANYRRIEGTVSPCAAIGSLPFTPEESYRALVNYQSMEVLSDESLGLRDAFNLDFNGRKRIDPDFVGIDKGISILMLYNFKNPNFISNLGTNNQFIKEAFEINQFKKIG